MKELLTKYKDFKKRLTRKWAQHYANLIVKQLEHSMDSEWQFNYWLNQGIALDMRMIEIYDIYLD